MYAMDELHKDFQKLGFNQQEAKVYIYLVKTGPKIAREIATVLQMTKLQVYSALKELQRKDLVESIFGYPCRFKAVPANKVLQLLVDAKRQEARVFEREASTTLTKLKALQYNNVNGITDRFAIIADMNRIVSRSMQFAQGYTKEFRVCYYFASAIDVTRFLDFLDQITRRRPPLNMHIQMLTNLSNTTLPWIEMVVKETKKFDLKNMTIEWRNVDIPMEEFPRICMLDNREALVFLTNPAIDAKKPKEAKTLWTDNEQILYILDKYMNCLWDSSIDIHQKLAQLVPPKQQVSRI